MSKQAFLFVFFGIFSFFQLLNAQTWEPAKRITWNHGNSISPEITVDPDDHIHIVWTDKSPGNDEIYYKKSTDGGNSWTTKRLTYNSSYSSYTAVTSDSNSHIHLVWEDHESGNPEIYYKRSTDGGATWTSSKRLSWTSGDSEDPAISVDSNNFIYVVWNDDTPGNHEIYYKRSTDGGTSWGGIKRLTWTPGLSYAPVITVDWNNHIHIVWDDWTHGAAEIYYKRSTNGGLSWKTKRLTWNFGYSYHQSITHDSGSNIHVVWHDDTFGAAEVCFKKSTNEGTTWMNKRLSWNPGNSWFPVIAIDSNNFIHVVWNDDMNGGYTNFKIFYKRSTDGGITWDVTKRLTWNTDNSYLPAIAVDSMNNIHVVWGDNTPGNYEIYYKKGIQ